MKKLFGKINSEEHDFWMSYTDLMSGFLVVFIVISVILYNYYSIEKEKYHNLFETFENMDPDEIEEKFTAMNNELDSLKGANLKNLINEYKDIFVSNDEIVVDINSDRGSIILTRKKSSDYLFPSGSHDFEPALKDFLDNVRKQLVEKTMELWARHKYQDVELRIEGHTDPNGKKGMDRGSDESFLWNLALSSERANAVYEYIIKSDELTVDEKTFVKKNMISVGYSFSDRVSNNNIDNINLDPSSRRIEFRIISK